MKLHIQQINEGEDEIILKYHKMTHEISDIIQYLNTDTQKIIGSYDNQIYHVPLRDIYYFESVDANTYAYTKDKILKVSNTLQQLQISLANSSFFRCSKS